MVVVSPILALMADQKQRLEKMKISVGVIEEKSRMESQDVNGRSTTYYYFCRLFMKVLLLISFHSNLMCSSKTSYFNG